MSERYTIGLDYGTLSVRALLVNISDGKEVACAVYEYPHGVMDKCLPSGRPLGADWALEHPQDYLDGAVYTIKSVIGQSKVSPEDIIGLGVDFTTCTVLPVKADGTPLCFLDEYKDDPHAYVKLWKHHAAQYEANRINELARQRGEAWLNRYGGKISSEWLFPKIMQVMDEAPKVYDDTDFFIEAGDWIVWQLCGVRTRSSCFAGYKAMWSQAEGFPSREFLGSLDKRLESIVGTKLDSKIDSVGSRAGFLTQKMSDLTGLSVKTAVTVCHADAHVCVPAVKIAQSGKMMIIMGTSGCHMMVSEEYHEIPGLCGVVQDGIIPGFFGYEAGQCCVGDHFSWFIDNCLPASYRDAAKAEGVNIHKYLRRKAEGLRPGQSGLIALDWWNGNRSVLVDSDLSGLIIGMTLNTLPEEIYRALIEATAYGTRVIIEALRHNGVPVNEICASGGIALKDPMMMQIYSDVLNMPVRIAGSEQGPALGSAIFAAAAAGTESGGYANILDASEAMGSLSDTLYTPVKENAGIYDKLYAEYLKLHDLFGRGGCDTMKQLKAIKLGMQRAE